MRSQEKSVVEAALAFVESPNDNTTRALNESVKEYKAWRAEVDARPLWRWVFINKEMFDADVPLPEAVAFHGDEKRWCLISNDNLECAGAVNVWREGDSYSVNIEGDEARSSQTFEKFEWAVEEVERHTTDATGWPHDECAEWPVDSEGEEK